MIAFAIGIVVGAGGLYAIQRYRARQIKAQADTAAAWQGKK